MLTLSDAFEDEFRKTSCEPVFLVSVWTDTSGPLMFCTGSRTITFPDIYNMFDGSTDPGMVAPPSVAQVTPFVNEIDPVHRNMQRTSCTVTFVDDGAIRDFIKNNRVKNQSLVVSLGTANLAQQDFAPVFRGLIKKWVPREGQIDVLADDHSDYPFDRKYFGTWLNKHPLEAIKKILEDSGLPAGVIETSDFDLTQSAHDGIEHYVNSYQGSRIHASPYFNPRRIDAPLELSSFVVCAELAKTMVGSVWFAEDGKLRFTRFDSSASEVVHWTADDIKEFEQLDELVVNQIEINLSSARGMLTSGEQLLPTESTIVAKDTTSQTAYAAPGETVGVFAEAVDFELIAYRSSVFNYGDIANHSAFDLKLWRPWGLCGTRVSGAYTTGPWESMQTATTNLSVSNPAYFLIDEEVVKCVGMDLEEYDVETANEFDGDGDPTAKDLPVFATATITSANRGLLGTTKGTHTQGTNVVDVTAAYDFAETTIRRFSNGAPTIQVTTSLMHCGVQVGDLVTLENDIYLSFGRDGITSSVKFEVTKKEVRLDDSQAGCHFTLVYATESSPPAIVKTYDWWRRELGKGLLAELAEAADREVNASNHVNSGLGVTSSGLDITVESGFGARGSRLSPLLQSQTVTVRPSMDHYISFSVSDKCVVRQSVATGAATPALGPDCVLLAKAVAGSTSCTLTDLRNFGAIRPRNTSTTDFEQGANLVPNPDFETWSRGVLYPPDHWEVRGGASGITWGTHATREETTTYSGNYALNINLSTLAGSYIQSHPFRVERDRVYQFGISVKGSSATAQEMVQIEWLTEAKANISAPILVNHNATSGTTDMTRYDVFTTAPSTAVYARILLSKWGDASPANGIFDSIRMVRAMPSFYVTNTTQTLGKSGPTAIDFDVEAHDTGDNFDVTLGQNKFTAPFAGLYTFSAQIIGSNLTNGHVDSYLWLAKNGGEIVRATKSYTGTANEYDYKLDSGLIELDAGDYLQVVYTSANTTDSVFTGSTTQNFFSGAQIQ